MLSEKHRLFWVYCFNDTCLIVTNLKVSVFQTTDENWKLKVIKEATTVIYKVVLYRICVNF
jgi:hypothetical protein